MGARHITGRPTHRVAFWFWVVLGGLAASAPPARADLDVSVSTNKPQVRPGEALYYRVTAHNDSSSPVTLGFPSSIQAQVSADNGPYVPNVGTLAITHATVPANGSKTWSFRHGWTSRPLDYGLHDVRGRVLGVGAAGPVPFEVVRPVYPTESFLIDFDHVPGTDERITSAEELWPYGVRFRSQFDRTGTGATYLTPTPGIYGRPDDHDDRQGRRGQRAGRGAVATGVAVSYLHRPDERFEPRADRVAGVVADEPQRVGGDRQPVRQPQP